MVVLNPKEGDIVLARPCEQHKPHVCLRRSNTLLGNPSGPTSEGSLSYCTLPSPPSPPPPPTPLGAPSRRPHVETQIIPRTVAMDAAEERLANALVVVVGGTRPAISLAQVLHYLASFFQVIEHNVVVRCSALDDFILMFLDRSVADKVLLSNPPTWSPFVLLFRQWHR
jgi:hypothetical protein